MCHTTVGEQIAKGRDVYLPDECAMGQVNGNPYNVIKLNQNMIFDFKSNISGKNWTKNFK